MSGPRQASPPRTGSGPRQPGGPRRARRAVAGPARAAGQATPEASYARAAQPEPPALATAPPLEPPRPLSAWQQLLEEINRLLRDPTLTRALQAFAARTVAVLRGLPSLLGDVARSVARALARIRLPRRLLLGLLALLLPLALLALLSSSDDEPAGRAAPDRTAQAPAAAEAGRGFSLPAVGMPQLLAQPDEVRPVRVALVLDRTYDTPALRRELRALGGWLAENHAAGTRVAVIDAAGRRASAPLSADRLGTARLTRQRASTAAAVRSALARRNGRGLVVSLGAAATAPGAAKRLQIATRAGAATESGAALASRRRARVTIDDRRPNALAASVARGIMAVSGERERR